MILPGQGFDLDGDLYPSALRGKCVSAAMPGPRASCEIQDSLPFQVLLNPDFPLYDQAAAKLREAQLSGSASTARSGLVGKRLSPRAQQAANDAGGGGAV